MISNSDDILDIRDIIERYEELEALADPDDDDNEEFHLLGNLLSELKGCGGSHQWKGDWYPDSLISGSYFRDYAEELAYDIGAIDPKASWPLNHIDWVKAADELKGDYSIVEFDGESYWYR
jgi:hypothetical protein